jgi:hypothetical protein
MVLEAKRNSFYFKLPNTRCWICGSNSDLTREHKIKRTQTENFFTNGGMVVHHGSFERKLAQGPKSSALKFTTKICNNCNSSTTQNADFAFEQFINALKNSWSEDYNVEQTGRTPMFGEYTAPDTELARYFSKFVSQKMSRLGCAKKIKALEAYEYATIVDHSTNAFNRVIESKSIG